MWLFSRCRRESKFSWRHHFEPRTPPIDRNCAMLGRETTMAKLLLIEDDREMAGENIAELVDHGFEVDWAATGIEGLDKARSGEPDALIVDRLLPGMDGVTIVEA